MIKIPTEKREKLRKVKEYIIGKESQLGRKLTLEEKNQGISKWFKKQEYNDLLNSMNVGSFLFTSNDGDNEVDVLNLKAAPIDNAHVYDDPLDEYILKYEIKNEQEVIMAVLAKKQERARDCYKALLTLFCIKKGFRELYPVLDQEIIDDFHKNGNIPKQFEIYQKYHPKITNINSAGVMASALLKELLADIVTYLERKNN